MLKILQLTTAVVLLAAVIVLVPPAVSFFAVADDIRATDWQIKPGVQPLTAPLAKK